MRFALYALHTHLARKARVYLALGIVLVAGVFTWWQLVMPPAAFPRNSFVIVRSDAPVSVIAEELSEQAVIRSPLAFSLYMRVTGADRSVHAGRYLFEKPLTLFEVADRIKTGETGVKSIRVTFPEGYSVREMGIELERALPDFDRTRWEEVAVPYEGMLFPDTYFFEPDATAELIVERMRATFDEKTAALQTEIGERALALSDIVIMASLIEKEANTPEDRRIVSGILWNRLRYEMPLQVDAVFGYIRGIPGYVPTGDDPEMDSPYNTYRNRGLPPGPIANPGLDALTAALYPMSSDYFYYLTGTDGQMYYAETFEEHKRNVERYLD